MQAYGNMAGGHQEHLFKRDGLVYKYIRYPAKLEVSAYTKLHATLLSPFICKMFGSKIIDDGTYIILEDLAAYFDGPYDTIDIKVGIHKAHDTYINKSTFKISGCIKNG